MPKPTNQALAKYTVRYHNITLVWDTKVAETSRIPSPIPFGVRQSRLFRGLQILILILFENSRKTLNNVVST